MFKRKFSNAKKTKIKGITFDSKLEGNRYLYLLDLEKKGKIKNLQLQYPFELIAKQNKGKNIVPSVCKESAKTIRAVKYYADFVYQRVVDGVWVVNDTKGRSSEVYKLKMKLFIALNGDKYQFIETYKDSKRNNFTIY